MAEGERAEAKPTKRVLLMEFETEIGAVQLPEEIRKALEGQLGEIGDGDKLTILVPVGEAEGGPKAVIESSAKVRGRFRAISLDSYSQGHEAVPPEQQKFELKPL